MSIKYAYSLFPSTRQSLELNTYYSNRHTFLSKRLFLVINIFPLAESYFIYCQHLSFSITNHKLDITNEKEIKNKKHVKLLVVLKVYMDIFFRKLQQ